MFALYKLRTKVLFKNPFLIFDFLLSFIFILIFGSIAKTVSPLEQVQTTAFTGVFGTVLAMLILNSGLYSFGFSFFKMKESVLLRRIGASKISKPQAIVSFIFSGFTLLGIVLVWSFLITYIFGLLNVIPKLEWGNLINNNGLNLVALFVGIIIGSLSAYILSFFFISISPNSEIYNTFTTFYFFIAVFLGGGLYSAGDTPEWMNIIGKLTPVGWNSSFITDALLGYNVWSLGGYASVEAWEASLNLFMPIIFATLAGLASIKLFRWDS